MNELEKIISEINENENLKNLEVFKSKYWIIDDETILDYGCAYDRAYDIAYNHADSDDLECARLQGTVSVFLENEINSLIDQGEKWFYWFCLPGCLPDSDAFGPFDSELDALKDSLNQFGY